MCPLTLSAGVSTQTLQSHVQQISSVSTLEPLRSPKFTSSPPLQPSPWISPGSATWPTATHGLRTTPRSGQAKIPHTRRIASRGSPGSHGATRVFTPCRPSTFRASPLVNGVASLSASDSFQLDVQIDVQIDESVVDETPSSFLPLVPSLTFEKSITSAPRKSAGGLRICGSYDPRPPGLKSMPPAFSPSPLK